MTREEAIADIKNNIKPVVGGKSLDMAIEALQAEPIRCKDCSQKHIGGSVTHYYWCDLWDREVDDTDHCAWGEGSEVEE